MSKCYVEPYLMPAADMGKDNPLPDIKNNAYIHAKIELTENVNQEDRKYINCGMIPTLLPYTEQNGYNRDRKDKIFKAVVLENKYLKAVFLPELGGRLWSLIDKEKNKELLYCNPVYQPGNLALRNAWFSGGVEFNVSIKGHNPLTCDSIFARKIKMSDGSEGIRIYDYERIRGVAYGFDAWIPEDSKMLYIRPRIENRTGREIWMYWWSNIAVPETPETRVIAPADDTFINYFGNNHYVLDQKPIKYVMDVDISYPNNLPRSIDFFYRIDKKDDKWITSVDKDGYGLIQCSTKELIGRKLFLWGQGAGGKNWNQFLSDGTNSGYVEIQAGLAYTQLEHIPMQDGEVWSWVEGYGALNGDKNEMHGSRSQAIKEAENGLAKIFPNGMTDTLDAAKEITAELGDFVLIGSGWGALENLRRVADGEISLSDTYVFPENCLTETQLEWIYFIKNNVLAQRPVDEEPKGYLVDALWCERLEKAITKPENNHWYAYMHLGVMRYAAGDVNGAKEAFEKSVDLTPNAWCYRNLAMIWRNELGDKAKAVEYMTKAVALNNNCRGILLDTATTYIAADMYGKWMELFETLDAKWQNDGRLQLNYVSALLKEKRYEEAAKILKPGFSIPDMKEADTDLSDIWFELYSNIISKQTGITDVDELNKLVEETYPLGDLDFRTH